MRQMTRDEAIAIARRHFAAKHNPTGYGGPFDLHDWVIDAIMDASNPDPTTLCGQLHAAVDRWVKDSAPRLRDEIDFAALKITISDPGGDDDGTLTVDFRLEEESCFTSEKCNRGGGRVPGVEYL